MGIINEHWFPSLFHTRTEIETWRREYNEERSKKALGGLTPADYAKQLNRQRTPKHPAMSEFLPKNERITNAIGRKLTGITSESTMKQVFLQTAQNKVNRAN